MAPIRQARRFQPNRLILRGRKIFIENQPISRAPGSFTTLGIVAGEDVQQNVTFKTGNPATVVDITGWNVRMTIKTPTPTILNIGNGGIVMSNPTQGVFVINIPSYQTANLAPGTWDWDLWLTDTLGNDIPLLVGSFDVTSSITQMP